MRIISYKDAGSNQNCTRSEILLRSRSVPIFPVPVRAKKLLLGLVWFFCRISCTAALPKGNFCKFVHGCGACPKPVRCYNDDPCAWTPRNTFVKDLQNLPVFSGVQRCAACAPPCPLRLVTGLVFPFFRYVSRFLRPPAGTPKISARGGRIRRAFSTPCRGAFRAWGKGGGNTNRCRRKC